jgi:hypothetical protein
MSKEVFPVDENDTDIMVTLDLDDGMSQDCEIISIFEVDGSDYIALMPVDEDGNPVDEDNVIIDDEEAIVYLYKYSEDADGSPSLDNIDSDEEYDKVAKAFDEL